MGKDIASKEGHAFAAEILDFMREKLMDYQNETNNLYNLEATPAKGLLIVLLRKINNFIQG
jgi:ribonucleoside-triphosphate reductase